MRKFIAVSLLILGSAVPSLASADRGPRSPWYIGFGVGFSPNAQFKSEGTTFDFEDYTDSSSNIAMRFMVGGTLSAKHLLGADIGFVTSAGSDDYSDYIVLMSHEVVSYTFYPATKGFFLRAGAGLGHLNFSRNSNTFGDLDGRSDGAAVLLGLGYSFWIGRTFSIGLNLDHEMHSYSSTSGDYPDVDSASATQFAVTFDWY